MSSLPPITRVTAGEPEAQSADPVAANVQALKALFPDAFSEDGVDFDTLRQLLGDAVDDGEEKYGLNWSGKRRARRLALTPSLGTLLPVPEDSVDWDKTKNLMIEGDNLEVLKLLQKSYAGKIKLIYIDPPYNTGNDFVYPDDYADSLGNYLRRTGQVDDGGVKNTSNAESGGRYHTEWLNMMLPRLMLARDLLRRDGVLLVSIDDAEIANIRSILGDLFGEDNFVASLFWEKGRKNDARLVSSGHDYILIYAKDRAHLSELGVRWREEKPGAADIQAEYLRLKKLHGDNKTLIEAGLGDFYKSLPKDHPSRKLTRYRNVDDQGVWRDDNMSWPGGNGPTYDVVHPITGKPCKVPDGGWRYSTLSKMNEMISTGKVAFRPDHNDSPIRKTYLVQVSDDGDDDGADSAIQVAGTYFYRSALQASSLMSSMFGQKVFDFPKDQEILGKWFSYVTGNDREAIVLDFFAGSGTTGHAVMTQNAADGGNRRYILVQLPEPLDPANKDQRIAADFCDSLGKPRTIAELTKERLRRSAAKVKGENPDTTADLGFRAYKLATSNLKAWVPGGDLEADLLSAADNLTPGRSEDDLLVELLLKRGIDLAEPSQTRVIAGRTVHAFGGGVMLACLGDVRVADAEALADGMADWVEALSPVAKTMIFFKDAGFENDVAKTNVAKILEQRLNGRGPGEAHLLEAVRSV